MADGHQTIHVDIRPHVAALARPGDTILIGFDHTLDEAELEAVHEAFEGFTQETGVHVAVVERASSMVIARPDEPIPFELAEGIDKEFPDEVAG